MLVVPQLAFSSRAIAAGDVLPPVREARELARMGAGELSLLDVDGELGVEHLPEWVGTLQAVAGAPVRSDSRTHHGAAVERLARAGFSTVVVGAGAALDAAFMRWAIDLLGTRLAVELQADGEYLFDPPAHRLDATLADVLGDVHLQGARRIVVRDVTGDEVPLALLQTLGDRAPGTTFTYQGAIGGPGDVALLAELGALVEAALVPADRVLDGSFDLAAARRAAGA